MDRRRTGDERLRLVAVGAVLVALVLFSINSIWIRKADATVDAFATWRMWWSVPLLAPLVLASSLRGRRPRARRDPARELAERRALTPRLRLVIAAVGVVFATAALFNFSAIDQTTLVNVGVINSLQPAIVGLVAGRWLGETVDWRYFTRAALAIAGASLVAFASSGQGTWSLRGDLLALVGTVLNSAWFLAGRWIRSRVHVDATGYMLGVFASAALVLTLFVTVTGRGLGVPASVVGFALLTALGGTAGHTLIAWSHRYLPASVSSLFLLTQPVLIGVVGWIAFSEELGFLHVAGAALVLGSLAGIVSAGHEPPPTPAGALPDLRDDEPEDPPPRE